MSKNLQFGFTSEHQKPAAGEDPSLFWINKYGEERGEMAKVAFDLMNTIVCLWTGSDLIPPHYENGLAVIFPFLQFLEDLAKGTPRVQSLLRFEGAVWEERSELYAFGTLLRDDVLRHVRNNEYRVRLYGDLSEFKDILSFVELSHDSSEAALHDHPEEMALAMLQSSNLLEDNAYEYLLEHIVSLAWRVGEKYRISSLHPSLWAIRRCIHKEQRKSAQHYDFARFFPIFVTLLDCVHPFPWQKKEPSGERTREAVLAILKECVAMCKAESPAASLPDLQRFLALETDQVEKSEEERDGKSEWPSKG